MKKHEYQEHEWTQKKMKNGMTEPNEKTTGRRNEMNEQIYDITN